MEDLHDLYKERAEIVDAESEVADAKKYVRVGGLFWRFYEWAERQLVKERADVQAEIDDIINQRKGD